MRPSIWQALHDGVPANAGFAVPGPRPEPASNLQRGAEWCRSLRMNRIVLGAWLGIAFGVADALMTVFGKHPERTSGILLQAFFT